MIVKSHVFFRAWIFSSMSLSDVGHVDFLEQASKHGDYVIVGIHTDPVSRTCSQLKVATNA